MKIPDCLVNVVGLSATTCECIEGQEGDAQAVSLSGYYLDDPEYGFPLQVPKNLQDCRGNDLWTRLANARSAGIQQFLTDFGAQLLSGPYNKRVEPFNGPLGDDRHSLNLSPSNFIALKIKAKLWKGVIAKIHKLTFYAAGVNGQVIAVRLYTEDGLRTGTITATMSVTMSGVTGILTPTTPQEFNFQSDINEQQDLYLVIDCQDYVGIQPKNNPIKCGSCNNKEKWHPYFYANGVTVTTLEGLIDASDTSYAYGFRLQLSVACGNSWLCAGFDYVNDPWARVMAECLSIYGMKKLAGIILNSPHPETYTIVSREEIIVHRNRLDELLKARMPWLAENIPPFSTDCFTCNEKVKVAEYLV